MLQMLNVLTEGMLFAQMEKFENFFINGAEVLAEIDTSGCIEFGTTNGQTIIIYDLAEDGRKHIRYECCFSILFDLPVIQNVYGRDGKLYEYKFDKWYHRAETMMA